MFLVKQKEIKGKPVCEQTGSNCELEESFWKMEGHNLFRCENCHKTYGQKKKENKNQTKLEIKHG